MKARRLETLFGIVLGATAVGARGGCGPCPEDMTETIVVLPASGDAGADAGSPDGGWSEGELSHEECVELCGADVISCGKRLVADDMPAYDCTRPAECGAGRRPAGFSPAPGLPAPSLVAAWLARAAELEAASVDAFRILRRELAAHGAPRALLRASSRAAADERRHARLAASLARRRGAAPVRPVLHGSPPRDLERIAIENAVEGCVRETFAALVARHQATAARDPEVRAMISRIAPDEARHAALAWRVDAWVRARSSRKTRAMIADARERATRELMRVAGRAVPRQLVVELGLPAAEQATALAAALFSALS